jgi:hypothetical protein
MKDPFKGEFSKNREKSGKNLSGPERGNFLGLGPFF